MDNKNSFPAGMKGIYTDNTDNRKQKRLADTGPTIDFKGRLPIYWGIDLVMVLISLTLTIRVITNWDTILFVAAQIVSKILVVATILVVLAVVIAVVLGIRNKRVW